MRKLESAAPGHVEAVRRDFIDLLTPEELAAVHRVFARVDDTIGAREE
ncbi:transcriptional regulator [Mycobacteroides abscessus subsp. abscessus]|nr:transcriptional regulator [Mycobacteroides abscessus subsp. abscessus]